MLAFVHIEKCAGSTFKAVLQRNYGVGYCDVRPLYPWSEKRADPAKTGAYNEIVRGGGNPRQFGARDLKTYSRLAPWLRCIAGHSIRPCLGLEAAVPNVNYITIFREPTSRYVSYNTYGTGNPRRPWGFSFEEYLEKENFHNFQTKKIACKEDLCAAKEILRESFLLVGVMERFDEFLVLLQRKIGGNHFEIGYRSVNMQLPRHSDFSSRFKERIRQNNSTDIELYRYVVDTILPRQRREFGSGLDGAVARFKMDNAYTRAGHSVPVVAQKLLNRLYFDPAAGLIRRAAGWPWQGAY